MPKLFTYGTLSLPEVQLKVIGRVVDMASDILPGYKRGKIEINGNTYFIAESSIKDEIVGCVLEVKENDFIALDEYETSNYRREEAILKSGTLAWVYLR